MTLEIQILDLKFKKLLNVLEILEKKTPPHANPLQLSSCTEIPGTVTSGICVGRLQKSIPRD